MTLNIKKLLEMPPTVDFAVTYHPTTVSALEAINSAETTIITISEADNTPEHRYKAIETEINVLDQSTHWEIISYMELPYEPEIEGDPVEGLVLTLLSYIGLFAGTSWILKKLKNKITRQ